MGNLYDRARLGILYDLFDPSASSFGSLDEVLDIVDDPTNGPVPIYASLHAARPLVVQTDSEVSYTGPYARAQLVRNTAGQSFTVDSINYIARTTGIQWAQATAGSTDARWVGFGVKQLGASGTHYLIGATPITAIGGNWIVANCIDLANDTVQISKAAHTLNPVAEGDEIGIARIYNDTLPSPLSASTQYFIKTGTLTVGADTVTFKLATVSGGGTAVNFAGTEHFQFIKCVPLTITSPIIPTVPALAGYIQVA